MFQKVFLQIFEYKGWFYRLCKNMFKVSLVVLVAGFGVVIARPQADLDEFNSDLARDFGGPFDVSLF